MHAFRPRDDRRHRQLRGDRELLAASSPVTGSPAKPPPTAVRIPAPKEPRCCSSMKTTQNRAAESVRGDGKGRPPAAKLTLSRNTAFAPAKLLEQPPRCAQNDSGRNAPGRTLPAVSARPRPLEMESDRRRLRQQVIRPTGLIDPPVEIRTGRMDSGGRSWHHAEWQGATGRQGGLPHAGDSTG